MSKGIILPEFSNRIEDGLFLIAFMKPSAKDEDEFKKIVRPGAIIFANETNNLPVYMNVQDFMKDIIEADTNSDIDKLFRFTIEDIQNIIVWKCQPIGDLNNTAQDTVKLTNAVLLINPMNMDRLRADIRLYAAKYGKLPKEEKKEIISDIDVTTVDV